MKLFIRIIIILFSFYLILCTFFYVMQERFIFYPDKLDKDFTYGFSHTFDEMNIKMSDNADLNGLLFRADTTKGLILYLHGNAGAVDMWGRLASVYTDSGYDIFFYDYRGFGKSDSEIISQEQFFDDAQRVYDTMREKYNEDSIIVLGFSIGTCPAAKLAAENNPKLLILQAPYYDLTGVIRDICPVIPSFLVKYKLETNKYLRECKMPVVIFHGDDDWTIDHSHSVRLSELLKEGDMFVTLEGEQHNGITDNEEYRRELKEILSR